jgi:hypothetical protein
MPRRSGHVATHCHRARVEAAPLKLRPHSLSPSHTLSLPGRGDLSPTLADALLSAYHPNTASIGRAPEEPPPGTLARTAFPSTTSSFWCHRFSDLVNTPTSTIIPFHGEIRP